MDEFKKELEDYFCRFTFGQFVTLILLEIVTLFFVFYLGARYGTDLLGNKSDIAKSTESVLPKDSPKTVDEIVGSPSVEYTYPEVLTGKDDSKAIRFKPSGMTADEYEKKKATPPPVKPVDDVAAAAREEPIEPTPVQPAPPPVQPVQPEEPQQVLKKVEATSVEEEKPRGKFSIQVGSYQSPAEAETSKNSWKKKGYSSFVSVGEIPSKGTWHRVRIGGFKTRDEAEKFLQKFRQREKASALIVLSRS